MEVWFSLLTGCFKFHSYSDLNGYQCGLDSNGKDLQKSGLVELGHRICLRTYYNKEIQGEVKDEKETLISVIQKNSFNRCNESKRKKRDFKMVYLGWLYFDVKRNKYVSVRATTEVEPDKLSLKIQQIKTKY